MVPYISKIKDVRVWIGLIWLRIGPVSDICVPSNEPLGFLRSDGYPDYLTDYWLL
jgi:hypothetical protein